jgi:hypothetical protein
LTQVSIIPAVVCCSDASPLPRTSWQGDQVLTGGSGVAETADVARDQGWEGAGAVQDAHVFDLKKLKTILALGKLGLFALAQPEKQ